MIRKSGAMHVVTTRRQYKDKVYETHLLRRSYREDGKVKNETLANLSHLPAAAIQLIRESLAGRQHVIAGEDFEIERALPHGHVAALSAMANKLGMATLLALPVPSATSLLVSSSPGPPIRPPSWAQQGGGPTPPSELIWSLRHLCRRGL